MGSSWGPTCCGTTRGATLQGLPVLGGADGLPYLVRRHRIEMVVVVPADLDGLDERVREMCGEAGVQVKSMGRLIE